MLRGRRGGRYDTTLRYPLEITPAAAGPDAPVEEDEEVEA